MREFPPMGTTTILSTDGSDLSIRAASAGLALLRPTDTIIVVTVIDDLDPTLAADGGGHAGPALSHEEAEELRATAISEGDSAVQRAAVALGLEGVETRVLEGRPGPALCSFAEEISASAAGDGHEGSRRDETGVARIGVRLRRAQRPLSRGRHGRELTSRGRVGPPSSHRQARPMGSR